MGPGPDVINTNPAGFTEQILLIRRIIVIKHKNQKKFRSPKKWSPNEEIFEHPML
jgi:hypothetical protein